MKLKTDARSVSCRAATARYRKTEKGKLTGTKYQQGSVFREYQSTYKKSKKYKAYQAQYGRTSDNIQAQARYRSSPGGKANSRRYCKMYSQLPYGRFMIYRKGAKHRGISFELTFKQFMTFWQKPCHYSGHAIATVGLDRVDNSKGYTMSNVVPCCTACNLGKRAMSSEAYVAHCAAVAEHSKRKGV